MKDLSSRWAVATLTVPVLLMLGLTMMGGGERTSAATSSTDAVVAVAFVSKFGSEPVTSYQRILLNVSAVRLNPSTDPNVSESDGGWITIPVPAGVGTSSGVVVVSTGNNFGGTFSGSNSVAIGEGLSEIQIDLGAIQNIAEIFNAQAVTAATYHQVELLLDTTTPGNAVPLCAGTAEGCINYRALFPTPTPSTFSIRTSATVDLSAGQNLVTPLVIQIDPSVGTPPTASNQTIVINPTISVIDNTSVGSTVVNSHLGAIQGRITSSAAGGFTGSVSVTALSAGTDNVVEQLTLPTSCTGLASCDFILYLPAAAGGTNYDLAVAGASSSYAVLGAVNVVAGQINALAAPLAIQPRTTLSLTGKVSDSCSPGTGIQAATLDLLVPNAATSPTPDCSLVPRPAQCVVAASAATDDVGTYPLPGNASNPAPFSSVPVPAANAPYELVTTAAGFDRTPVTVTSSTGNTLNIAMSHSTVTGNVSLGGGDTGPASVFVAAEDSGTNNIENLQMVTIPSNLASVQYTMNVPDNVTQLDYFAFTQDLFDTAPQTATGHSIAVVSHVAAPGACPGSPVTVPPFTGMKCVGHGSAAGTVTSPMSNDTVVLSKSDGVNLVQIETVSVAPQGSASPVPSPGFYSLCAPADTYTLTHFRQATPAPTPVGSVIVTLNAPTIVPTPTPSPGVAPSPCPGICEINPPNQNSGCLTCTATSVVGP